MGGLGNQLFQIVTTIAYCIENGDNFVFRYSEMLGDRRTYWDSFLANLKAYTRTIETPAYEYYEPSFNYNRIPRSMTNVCLYGYFQSFLYFREIEEEVFSLFELRSQQQAIRSEMNNGRTISVHFRLGDYKDKQEYHPVLPIDYYRDALRLVGYSREDTVYIFCEAEDREYVKTLINQLDINEDRVIYVSDTVADWKQMLMMSCCNINIIANSTFSWWGAYFNNNPDKVVIRPKIWFGPRIQHDICDLFPDHWLSV
jgi:hypothetical protein